MIKLNFSLQLNYEINQPGCAFVLNIHAAHTLRQKVVYEQLSISQAIAQKMFVDSATGNRFLRLAPEVGPLALHYEATVELDHYQAPPHQIMETPVAQLPGQVLPYLYPSRYCQSDRLHRMAVREFGNLPMGYLRVQAIQAWVKDRIRFTPGASNASTSAVDTLVEQVGVCRDFAHLMIALCRAVNIPARFATGVDYGSDPAWGPPDFHAYVEAFLGGRWYIFDPTGMAIPMGFIRLGTGRDAADVAFATLFGPVLAHPPIIRIQAVGNGACGEPYRCPEALSTDEGEIGARAAVNTR